MTEGIKESLSALVDDEADEFETRRVIDEIARDQELSDKWHRYHLVRAVIRGTLVSSGMRERLWRVLDVQDAQEQKQADTVDHKRDDALDSGPNNRNHFYRVTGLGIAAAVAIVVIFLYRDQTRSATDLSAPVAAVVPSSSMMVPSQNDLTRVQAYMQQHVRHTSGVNSAKPIPKPEVASLRDGPESLGLLRWQVGWIPDGFRMTAVDPRSPSNIKRDVNMMMYSDGFSAFSVFVESMPETGAGDWVSRDGDTVIVRTPVPLPNQKLVTVVGEVSTPTATRIARSIQYRH